MVATLDCPENGPPHAGKIGLKPKRPRNWRGPFSNHGKLTQTVWRPLAAKPNAPMLANNSKSEAGSGMGAIS